MSTQPSPLSDILKDGQFVALSPTEQQQVLSHADPSFGQLRPEEFEQFRSKVGLPPALPSPQQQGARNIDKTVSPRDQFFADPKEKARAEKILGSPELTDVTPSAKDLVETLKVPASTAAAITAGSAAARMTPGGPIPKALVGAGVAGGSYLGLYNTGQRLQNFLSGKDEEGSPVQDLALQEIGGKAIGAVGRGVKAAAPSALGGVIGLLQKIPGLNFDPASVLTDGQLDMSKLKATYSQYLENMGPKSTPAKLLSPFFKGAEDLFAPGAKAAAIKTSGTAANAAIAQEASNVSGRALSTVENPNTLAMNIQNDLENSMQSATAQSNANADKAKLIAKSNTLPGIDKPSTELNELSIQQAGKPFNALDPQSQQTLLGMAQKFGIRGMIPGQTIEGPVFADTVANSAKSIMDKIQSLPYQTDDNKLIGNEVHQILTALNPDKTGKSSPIPFENAWDMKQDLDKIGYGDKFSPAIRKQFKDLSAQLNDDIEQSLSKWPNDPNKNGLQAWKTSKDLVGQRNAIFNPDRSGNKLGDIIEDADSPLPAVNKILSDPLQTKRALATGNIKINGQSISGNNLRQDLGAAKLIDMRDKATTLDPLGKGSNLSGQALLDQWNDPKFQDQKKMLFNQVQRSDYDQLFRNISITQQKQNAAGTWMNKYALVKGGLLLGPSLVAGSVSGMEHGLELAGLEIPMIAMSKIMTNHDSARALIAATSGQALGMSQQNFARTLFSGLKGATVSIVGADGTKTQGTFDRDGHWTPKDSAGSTTSQTTAQPDADKQ